MRRLSRLILVLILSSVILFAHGTALAYPSAKITAKVVDENGTPVKGAAVNISFEVSKPGGWGMDDFGKDGVSDNNGLFTALAAASAKIGITARKEGYYFSRSKYQFTSKSLMNRWEPWNPTVEIVLKKKRNPVGMVARDTDWIRAPALDIPVGYDLEKGDWVAPYGKGLVSDFIFTIRSKIKSYTEYTVNFDLTFSNALDGIQEYKFGKEEQSYYKWPFDAPVNGYLRKIHKEDKKIPGGLESNRKEDINYIFRVRTKTDKDGNIIEAYYGKILREFGLSPAPDLNTVIQFLYYFNPDGTTNLEFDPQKNLVKWKNRQDKRTHALKNP